MRDDDVWWALPALVPGPDPVGGLIRAIADGAREVGLAWSFAEVRTRLGGPGDLVDEVLLATPNGTRRRRLLVVVDPVRGSRRQSAGRVEARHGKWVDPSTVEPLSMDLSLNVSLRGTFPPATPAGTSAQRPPDVNIQVVGGRRRPCGRPLTVKLRWSSSLGVSC